MKTENFFFFQRNFLAQTGDPTGSGRGGESIFRSLYGDQATFFEAETKPRIKHVKKGTVSMVNNGQDMHGSQVSIASNLEIFYLRPGNTGNIFLHLQCNIVVLQVEKRCCTYYHPPQTLSRNKILLSQVEAACCIKLNWRLLFATIFFNLQQQILLRDNV